MTLSLTVLVGLLALEVDLGWAYYRRIAAKAAADAAVSAAAKAAMAGAIYTVQSKTACPSTLSASVPLQVGCMYAQSNGFTNGGGQTVSMAAGTTGSPVTGLTPSYWITATISESLPTGFGRVFGNALNPTVISSAAVFQTGTPSGCVYILDPNSAQALSISGGATLTSGCGIQVNSTSSQAVYLNGGASITTNGGAKTKIVGNYYLGGGASISPTPTTGAPVVTDPWAAMPVPSTGSCQSAVNMGNADVKTISPGTYCSQISVQGSATLTLNPGTYVLQNGFNVGNSGKMQASGGVTLYMTGGSSVVTGAGIVNLTAPTSGAYQGVLLWQALADTTSASLSNGGSEVLNGLLYFPGATLTYLGAGNQTGITATLAAKKISLSGGASITYPATTPYSGVTNAVSIIQ